MLKGTRLFIVASIVWLLLIAPSWSAAEQSKSRPLRRHSQITQPSLSAIPTRQIELSREDKGCKKGEENRASDLCAQWKAADAAALSAEWAINTFWLGVAGSVIGTLTLIAAGFAAWYARSAADAAREALDLERRSTASQLRPYLFIDKLVTKEIFPHEYQITIWLKNFGSIPARNIQFRSFCYIGGDIVSLREFRETHTLIDAGTAAPGHHRRTFDGFALSPNDYYKLENSIWNVFLRIEYTYADDGKNQFGEFIDYYMTGRGLEQRMFFLLTDSTREDEESRRSFMRETRADRKLLESRERAAKMQRIRLAS